MKNVKDEVYAALLKVTDNVSDVYPKDWADFPAIQYVEEDNSVVERTGNKEDKAKVRYRIDIWHNQSTSAATLAVDEAMAALGLVRTGCADTPDPSGLKHKQMRYEGIIDMYSDYVYWNN
ncbi:MAG: hypothetical protein Q4D16_19600 [Eubacteriales bacterium]|nr:hypothetical protein [Eubacteriales bacterium]